MIVEPCCTTPNNSGVHVIASTILLLWGKYNIESHVFSNFRIHGLQLARPGHSIML
jgi:hypothetical protein